MPTTRPPQRTSLARHWPALAILLLASHAVLHGFLRSHPGQAAITVFLVAPTALFALTALAIGIAAYDVLHGGWRRLLRGTAIFPIGALVASVLLALLTYRSYPSSYDGRVPGWCLALPLSGDIVVLQGGRSIESNDHAASPSAKYAYDLGLVRDGTTHRDDGNEARDYFVDGEMVLAPIDGQVVAIEDGMPDRTTITSPWGPLRRADGNYVVLEVDDNRYLFLARLKAGSILVRAGDTVTAGQPIARVGASGQSGVPHLHVHLQDHPVLGRGEAVPVEFCNYEATDWGESWNTATRVERGMPTGRDHPQVIRAGRPSLQR